MEIIPATIYQHIENIDAGIKYLNKFGHSYGPFTRIVEFRVHVITSEIHLEILASDEGFPKAEYYILGIKFVGYNMARTTFPSKLYLGQDLNIPKFEKGEIENCRFTLTSIYEENKFLEIECKKIIFDYWRTEIEEFFPEET